MKQLPGTSRTAAFENDARTNEFPFALGFCLPLVIFCVTVLVFFPTLENGFVNWDDEMNFLENPYYRGLGWIQLRWMFTTFHGSNYRPVAWMTSGLDYVIWELEAFGYHLTSLLLHALNGVLCYFLARRLLELSRTAADFKDLLSVAFFSALFFSTHPLRVEVIAWASARNDIVAGFFYLCTVLAYLKYATLTAEGPRQWRWFVGAMALYSLSLLSKGTGVTLPLVLLVLDVYPLRRLSVNKGSCFGPTVRQVWLEKIPLVSLAAGVAVLALLAKQSMGGMTRWENYGLGARLAQACYGITFYLVKTVFPYRLSPLYQLSDRFDPLDPVFVSAGFLVILTTVCLYRGRFAWPAGFASWTCYIAILFPVSGVFQSGPQMVADRYSYLACVPYALLAGAGFHYVAQWLCFRGSFRMRLSMPAVVGILTVAWFGTLSWRQTKVWRNSGTLWNHALSIDESSNYAHNNLGSYLQEKGKLEEATAHYLKALKIKPAYAEAQINLAMVLGQQGRIEESIKHFQLGLQIDPKNWKGHYYLGVNFANLRNWQQAAEEFRKSLTLSPDRSEVHIDLATVLLQSGNIDGAIIHLQEAVKLGASSAEVERKLRRLEEMKKALSRRESHTK